MIEILSGLLGGLGLFLIGMSMMTKGLRSAAGTALRNILGQWTRTPLRGLGSGVIITAIVQSSSAVTVAVIGFVNAGLISMRQSMGVIYGSNVGTTMTGWIVAAVGVNVKVKALALPLIGLGALMMLSGGNSKRASIGRACAGFGLFFLGIQVLQEGFTVLAPNIDFSSFDTGPLALPVFLGIGFILTLLMQSSSAAMAVVLTATISGIVPLADAAAAVIGTNIGTTSTAALSVIGATNNAKKVAFGHILFNAMTGLIALLLLAPLLAMARAAGGGSDPAVTLALFHTIFNILGALLFLPLTDRLVSLLDKRIATKLPELAKPRYLDRNVLRAPSLAVDALFMEVGRLGENIRLMAQKAMASNFRHGDMQRDKASLENLISSCRRFCSDLQGMALPEQISENLPKALRVLQYYTVVLEVMEMNAREHPTLDHSLPESVTEWDAKYRDTVKCVLNTAHTPCAPEFDHIHLMLDDLLNVYHELKQSLLKAGAAGEIELDDMVNLLEFYSRSRRMTEQAVKGTIYWSEMRESGEICRSATAENEFTWKANPDLKESKA